MEAHDNGFSEGIALDVNGYVSEGAGENLFLVALIDKASSTRLGRGPASCWASPATAC
jgi:hypothetical protein